MGCLYNDTFQSQWMFEEHFLKVIIKSRGFKKPASCMSLLSLPFMSDSFLIICVYLLPVCFKTA